VATVVVELQYLHDTSADVAAVFVVLQYLHNISADVATVVVVLWYLHNTSADKLHGYTVHQTMLKPFYCQLMHIMLKNTGLLKPKHVGA